MNLVISLSVALIAVSFTILVVYLVVTLKSAKASIDQVNDTLAEVRDKVDNIEVEAMGVLRNTNAITGDVREKIGALDTLFSSIGQISESVHQVTASAKEVSSTVSRNVVSRTEKVINDPKTTEVLKWATLAMQVWAKWKGIKNQEAEQASTHIKHKGDGYDE